MSDIYDQYDKATKTITGYAILLKGEYIGKVVFKRGNCRCYCYAHIHGLTMTKGQANGGGYDMASAACYNAFSKMLPKVLVNADERKAAWQIQGIKNALKDDGKHWDTAIMAAGYTVLNVV